MGMTKRRLKHKNDLKSNEQFTVLSMMFLKGNITKIDSDKVKTISSSSNPFKTLIREFIEIKLRKEEICNDSVSFVVPKIELTV